LSRLIQGVIENVTGNHFVFSDIPAFSTSDHFACIQGLLRSGEKFFISPLEIKWLAELMSGQVDLPLGNLFSKNKLDNSVTLLATACDDNISEKESEVVSHEISKS
jgi:hypothetical protein